MRSLVIALVLVVATAMVVAAQSEEMGVSPPSALADTATDASFELAITTPKATWSADEPIEVSATLAYLGQKEKRFVTSGGETIVLFEIEQLDGPIDTGYSRDTSCVRHRFARGDVKAYPFQKSVGPFGDMAKFWRSWLREPDLGLPAGTYRVTAHAEYGPPKCGETANLDAAVTIEVVGSISVHDAVYALNSLPGLLWPDDPVPASVAEFVPTARDELWSQAIDGLRLPLHLRFVDARCASDGGVALIFEELRPPYLTNTYAYTSRGSMPASQDDGWGSGGYSMSSVLDDPEFIHLMGDDTVPCP
jgi:hypothetical protein